MTGKVYSDTNAALEGVVFDGTTRISGGFRLSGSAENLITALKENGIKDLTVISNNCGADNFGLWVLLNNGQISYSAWGTVLSDRQSPSRASQVSFNALSALS